ncbi:MAG: hypothetical protein BGO55_21350 [Sphingobacteriales bacterium 50-39]|nr:MAG: hypothetical protein BGO55_21350 [Sphingobacteriales bacterium 50-39]
MKQLCLLLLTTLGLITARATRISGVVKDDKGNALPYASILVKGSTRGVTANNEGKYFLDLSPGDYTLVCQYVGYAREEKKIRVREEALVVNFQLALQQLSMGEVVVRPGGEDPAYEIIRHAIKKRKDYQSPLDSFTCEAYIKTLIKSRKVPKRILGQKIDEKDKKEMGVDSAGKGILFLSESLTKLSYKKPGKVKLEVLSGRESGSNGYGFTIPTFVNFYDNNVYVLAQQLNPRGFVSPIAESAFHYYRYKYLGSFWEDGKEVNKIQVIPRRKYEPLFSGTINITEGDWRIHSLDLLLLKESQLEILDTLSIRQIHAPIGKNGGDVWQVKDQVVYFTFSIMGFDAVGNFLNVYNNYDVAPRWRKKWFNNVFMKFDTAANKKTRAYWDSIRPLPLEPEEVTNYIIRDSIYQSGLDSLGSRRNRDSLLKKQGHITLLQVASTGINRSNFKQPSPFRWSMEPLLSNIEYNTVEGLNANIDGALSKSFDKGARVITLWPHIRYGFHNTRLNAWGTLSWDRRSFIGDGEDFSSTRQSWSVSGGRRVLQFNQDNPISEYVNGLYTLFFRRNYMKIYESWFGRLDYNVRMDNGMVIKANAAYEDRLPINNTTDYSLVHYNNGRDFTPNYPYEKLTAQFPRHQAVLTGVEVQYQPGQRYIEFPRRKIPVGSKYPTFSLMYQKGWNGVLGSNVNFDKWQFSVWDNVNLRLKGMLRYRLGIGGFLNDRSVFIQDYQHFSGNQTFIANQYMNGFQLAPYYANSTTSALYATGHIEQHFNGMLTNKIPLFRRLNWYLVAGANAFYVNGDNNYTEVFGGLENIFKLFRVDVVASYINGRYGQTGVRVGMGGLLGSGLRGRGR